MQFQQIFGMISVLLPGLSTQPALPCAFHASQRGGSIMEAALWTAEARE